MRNRTKLGLLSLLFLALAARDGLAFPRIPPDDQIIVERSELIVIGRLEPNSIQFVLHSPKTSGGQWLEHTARLVIERVLKGHSDAAVIPIVIHFGLTPAVGGRWEQAGGMIDLNFGRYPNYSPGSIQIVDTGGGSGFPEEGLDAGENNVWFLRRLGGELGWEPNENCDLGILDPRDIEPIRFADYLLCYLSDEPEPCVREQAPRIPEISPRANQYLIHREIERVAALPDPVVQIERALPP